MKNKTITLNVPHRLTQDQARSRIAAGVEEARSKYAGAFARVDDRWTGNHMEFNVGILGQAVTGRVDVHPDAVQLEVDLPWLFAALADQLRPQLQDQTRKILEALPEQR